MKNTKRFCSRTQNNNEAEKGVGRNGMNMLRHNKLTYVVKKIRR